MQKETMFCYLAELMVGMSAYVIKLDIKQKYTRFKMNAGKSSKFYNINM